MHEYPLLLLKRLFLTHLGIYSKKTLHIPEFFLYLSLFCLLTAACTRNNGF